MSSFVDVSQGLFQFWSQFTDGQKPVPAYKRYHVPETEEDVFPRIEFSVGMSSFDRETPLTAFLWCKQKQGMNVNAQRAVVLDQIRNAIPEKGVLFPLANGGAMWLRPNIDFLNDYDPPNEDAPEGEPIIGGRIAYIARFF